MKRFFSAFIIVFVLMTQAGFAADVPSFRSLDPENITLAHTDFKSVDDFNVYAYKCSPDTAKNFMKRYATRLVSSGSFKITAQFVRNIYGSTYDAIQFKYTGSKKVSKFFAVVAESSVKECNLQVFRFLGTETENIVLLFISPDLDYAEKDMPLSTPTQPTPVETTPIQTTPVSTNQNGGADVPDLEQLADEIVYHHNQRNGDGSITYIFKASGLSESRADEYVNQYINLLASNNFVQASYDKQKFSERVSKTRQSETWTFDYNGSKSISGLSDGKALHVKRVRDPRTGDTSFEIRVAKDLVFAGNYERPAPPPPGKTYCSDCNGGKCLTCGGDGYYWDGSGVEKPCAACDQGKCRRCHGTGYV